MKQIALNVGIIHLITELRTAKIVANEADTQSRNTPQWAFCR